MLVSTEVIVIMDFRKKAQDFLDNEKGYRLGFLRSEARNPLTMNLDRDFAAGSALGVKTLLSCDMALLPLIHSIAASAKFQFMVDCIRNCFARGGRVVFTGCGAAGRLAVLLESAWQEELPGDGRVLSLLTGGDFALVRSVENFEDYEQSGALQVRDLGMNEKDLLVGITATGETTSTIGSAFEVLARGGEVFMLICADENEASARLDRCRRLYSSPRVHVLSMPVGGMALTGSTRMQSSTMELLVAGAALEKAVFGETKAFAAYESMLTALFSEKSLAALGKTVDFESDVFRQGGLIDYLAEDLLIDLLSDTTERSPTFMTPPYHCHDMQAPEPWGMVRHPGLSTPEAWKLCLKRAPRCINWSEETYRSAGLEAVLAKGVPRISVNELMKIQIGNEEISARSGAYRGRISSEPAGVKLVSGCFVPAPVIPGRFRLVEHLRMKLIMNTVSTGVMTRLGRVCSNYMIYLNISNKKLIDRACRIISDLCGISYEDACLELFKTWSEVPEGTSPVAATLARLKAVPSL
ncbi:MAG: hypothetical protein IKS20_07385 [Victivallales bacterium]|nr:hypothetical protein [Victivallales bacterium]